jgi:hypothetical protein
VCVWTRSEYVPQTTDPEKKLRYGCGTHGVAGPDSGAVGAEGRGRGSEVSVPTPNAHPHPRNAILRRA